MSFCKFLNNNVNLLYITFNILCITGICQTKDGNLKILPPTKYNTTSADNQRTFNFMETIPPNSVLPITYTNLPTVPNYFAIVQVHSFRYNITLSYKPTIVPQSYVNGTNIGLYFSGTTEKQITAYVMNSNAENVTYLGALTVYPNDAPIPGGCNQEFPTEYAPYLRLSYTDILIRVDAQPASAILESKCGKSNITYSMYHKFLPERDFSAGKYFSIIRRMLSVSDVLEYGRKVSKPIDGSRMRRIYSAYRGIGELFTIIVTYENKSAAYVPIVTYTCNENEWSNECEILVSPFMQTLLGFLFFIGFLLCFFGHRCFKTGMFFHGFFIGSLISYIIIAMYKELFMEEFCVENVVSALLIGVASGLFWLSVWSYFGVPILSMFLPNVVLGFIVASIVFYSGGADFDVMQLDTNYWVMFITILFTLSAVFSLTTYHANILITSVLGSFCIIVPIDHYVGSYLKYIVINVIRRAVNPEFHTAVIDPPFQLRDLTVSILWITLFAMGFYIQCLNQRGKPPFPPPPFLQRRYDNLRRIANLVATEHEPLIQRGSYPSIYTYDPAEISGLRPHASDVVRHGSLPTTPHATSASANSPLSNADVDGARWAP